jgi:L-2-hydroxyglutarate oxidase LhgO
MTRPETILRAAGMTDARYNVIIIRWGGAVGLGVALEITRRFPRQKLLLVEKEDKVARHQSGHNSGVIHSGVYYKPGSLKARLCVAGAAAMVAFCREHAIPHNVCGKVIVATHKEEIPRLEELHKRGEANGLNRTSRDRFTKLREIEYHASGLQALVVPLTGVTRLCSCVRKYAQLIATNGGLCEPLLLSRGIHRSTEEIVVRTSGRVRDEAL